MDGLCAKPNAQITSELGIWDVGEGEKGRAGQALGRRCRLSPCNAVLPIIFCVCAPWGSVLWTPMFGLFSIGFHLLLVQGIGRCQFWRGLFRAVHGIATVSSMMTPC
jgi:hypothetical protein